MNARSVCKALARIFSAPTTRPVNEQPEGFFFVDHNGQIHHFARSSDRIGAAESDLEGKDMTRFRVDGARPAGGGHRSGAGGRCSGEGGCEHASC